MNPNESRMDLRFGPEIRFAVRTAVEAPFRVALESEFEQLKNRLLGEQLDRIEQPDMNAAIRRAANEAAALAWVTFYPMLVFPGLFEEKAAAARRRPSAGQSPRPGLAPRSRFSSPQWTPLKNRFRAQSAQV